MYQKILHNPLLFGDEISPQARSILTGLLTRDPSQRLGVNGAEEIRKHPFFEKHIDFKQLLQKKIQPPFKPSVSSPVDVSNFDTVFTAEEPTDSLVEGSQLSQTVQAQFAGAYSRPFGLDSELIGKQGSHTTALICPSVLKCAFSLLSVSFKYNCTGSAGLFAVITRTRYMLLGFWIGSDFLFSASTCFQIASLHSLL